MNDLTGQLVRHLRAALRRRAVATVDEEGARRAAVAVVLTEEAVPCLLLVRRRERAGDPWSGHVAFPGGFSSPEDESLETTAAREAEEETGLPLARIGELLGRLDDVAPRSVLLPRITVTPVVFAVASRFAVAPGPEVAETAWLPANQLFDPASRGVVVIDLPSGRREFEAISVAGFTIWGLTERVLAQIPPLLTQAGPDQ